MANGARDIEVAPEVAALVQDIMKPAKPATDRAPVTEKEARELPKVPFVRNPKRGS